MIKGSCGCGGICFEVNGPVSMNRYCHCVNCRKFSGTAQSAWGLARTDDYVLVLEETEVVKYDAGSGGLRAFCGDCGSPLWFEPADSPALRGIALGSIDEGYVAAPDSHWWVRSNPDWEVIFDDLPCFQTTATDDGAAS